MALCHWPQGGNEWLLYYSYFLKIVGIVYLSIFLLGYWCKFGLAWHDAGTPWDLTDVKFSAYWNVILWLYTALGFFMVLASSDPASFKPLLSWTMWAANLGHGIVALIAVFTDHSSSSAGELSGWSHSGWDKLFVAVPFWLSLWLANLFFARKVWGSYLLPWEVLPLPAGGFFAGPEPQEGEYDHRWTVYYSYFLKIVGIVYLSIFLLGYWCKFGLAWHDAGTPWDLTDVKFSAYWNMILWLYTSLGFYLVLASFDPHKAKPLLSWTMWAANLGHGIVALIAVFTDHSSSSAGELSGWSHSGWDKLFVAVPFWLSLWLANLFFARKVWGSSCLPWPVGEVGDPVKCHSYSDTNQVLEPTQAVETEQKTLSGWGDATERLESVKVESAPNPSAKVMPQIMSPRPVRKLNPYEVEMMGSSCPIPSLHSEDTRRKLRESNFFKISEDTKPSQVPCVKKMPWPAHHPESEHVDSLSRANSVLDDSSDWFRGQPTKSANDECEAQGAEDREQRVLVTTKKPDIPGCQPGQMSSVVESGVPVAKEEKKEEEKNKLKKEKKERKAMKKEKKEKKERKEKERKEESAPDVSSDRNLGKPKLRIVTNSLSDE